MLNSPIPEGDSGALAVKEWVPNYGKTNLGTAPLVPQLSNHLINKFISYYVSELAISTDGKT